ncbi:MAG: Ig-like domain-containing protein [Trueperaceae bacterium]|nr:Ig-like domain-containing protein [Trueperaceae bacterium]
MPTLAPSHPRIRRAVLAPLVALLATALVVSGCTTNVAPADPPVADLVDVRPAHQEEDVPLERNLTFHFDGPVDEAWLHEDRFAVDPPIGCAFAWHPDRHTLTCDPVAPLAPDTTYVLTLAGVTPPATASLGTASADATHTVTFTTRSEDGFATPRVASTVPADGWWDVRPDVGTLDVTFSVPMFAPTVEDALANGALTRGATADDADPLPCTDPTWNDAFTKVTCSYEAGAGHYALDVDATMLGASGEAMQGSTATAWVATPPPSLLATTWKGTFVTHWKKTSHDASLRFAPRRYDGTTRAVATVEDVGGGPFTSHLVFTPGDLRAGGTLHGNVAMCHTLHAVVEAGEVHGHLKAEGGPMCRRPPYSGSLHLTKSGTDTVRRPF